MTGSVTLKVCLVGPCSPNHLNDLLTDFSLERYSNNVFFPGVPVSTLAKELVNLGHEVIVVSTFFGSHDLAFHGSGITLHLLTSEISHRKRALTLFHKDRQKIFQKLKSLEFDVLHAHWSYEYALSALAFDSRTLITAHDSPLRILYHYRDPYWLLRFIISLFVKFKIENLCVVSDHLKRDWKTLMLYRKSIKVFPNSTPSDVVNISQEIALSNKVISVGDLSRLKNLKTLLEAWSIVMRTHRDWELHLIGPGLHLGGPMQLWASKNKFDENVVWRGRLQREEMKEIYRTTYIMVHPSLEESHCLSIIEAMANGIPVIGGINSGAVPDTVGNAGLLINVKSTDEISGAIVRLVESVELRQELSREAIMEVGKYRPDSHALNYVTEYQRIFYASN